MFSIIGDQQTDGTWKVGVTGAPPSAVIELRMTSLFNGSVIIFNLESDSSGNGNVPLTMFDQTHAIVARVLDESNDDTLHDMFFTPECTATHLVMVCSDVEKNPPQPAVATNKFLEAPESNQSTVTETAQGAQT